MRGREKVCRLARSVLVHLLDLWTINLECCSSLLGAVEEGEKPAPPLTLPTRRPPRASTLST